jgi:hypothetical protein
VARKQISSAEIRRPIVDVVRPDGATAHRELRIARLILHAVVVGVAAGDDGGRERGENEHAAPFGWKLLEVRRVERASLRCVRRIDERRLASYGNVLFDRPHIKRDIERDELLRPDDDVCVLVRFESLNLNTQRVTCRIQGGK